jgi:hypothetical protein
LRASARALAPPRGGVRRDVAQQRERVDPRADPLMHFAVREIVDDELDQSAPELAEDLEHRVDYPER